jgi:hypothetical protein
MPMPPKPVPGGAIDPRHHGDDHANRPPDHGHDGRPIPQQPWRDHDGRVIPPNRDHIGRIDNDEYRRNIHREQDHWNRGDHDYHWHQWNGTPVCHHYDDYGYHWWGFYVGSSYFWTRYYEDRYWWYDPYWHRWTYLHDNRWWWEEGGTTYVIINNNYYRYGDTGGTVVTPDPTPPVEVPPGRPSAPAPEPAQTMFYSQDGTRSVQILGDRKEAYLYDLTVADQNDRQARGRWLGAGVKSAQFTYEDKIEPAGKVQVIRQIELTFDDASKTAVSDSNGEREVQVAGDARTASLFNLKDDTIDPVILTDNATGVTLLNEEKQDAAGQTVRSLKLVFVSTKDDAGTESTLMFDRNGVAVVEGGTPPPPQPESAGPAPETKALQKMQSSPAFRALNDGFSW